MPLEIRELQIKVRIGDGEQNSAPNPSMGSNGEQNEMLVRAIVDKVIATLKEQQER